MDDIGSLEISWIQGFTNKSIAYVDNTTVCYSSGSHICFLNLETQIQSVLKSPGRGVGALTANGNNGIFAFSEQKLCPSIFVYIFPEVHLKNELKGAAQLDYTSLTLSEGGTYLGCCSALPEHTITVWNWENAEQICTQPNAGKGIVSLLFNPLNWLQLCALSTTGLTVWNIEKSGSFHVLKQSVIELPATDGSFVESLMPTLNIVKKEKVPYFGPEMPPSAIAGLQGDKADNILAKLCTKARLTITAICWTAKSELYVGCVEGFLLLVDPESLCVSVLFNPTTADATPELRQSNFQSLTLNKNGLITIGKENVVHCLQLKGNQINITQTWKTETAVTTVMLSPDLETLLLSSNTGQIYMLNPTSDKIGKVLDVLSGNFVAAALLHTGRNICVSVREFGELQLWSSDGVCLGSLSLQTQVTSLACCPVAQYAAVGTTSGYVLFIDLNSEEQPRLVHQVHLYNTPVDHLVFEKDGHYLFTSASDSHVYVLDAKPSKRFTVIGFTVVPGPILSLSSQSIRNSGEVKVLALCREQEGQSQNGNMLTVLTLPVRDISDTDCVDRHGVLSNNILKVCRYEVPHPLESCVLGVSEVFAYCHKRKTLLRFQLPQDTDSLSSQEVVQLTPEQEVKGHPLGPASLVLSPHNLWLASVGQDGLLRIQETVSMERYIELQCHSCRLGGVRSVSFSADSQTLLTAGFKDGSLLCTNLRNTGLDGGKMIEATLHSKSMEMFLMKMFNKENHVLIDLPAWGKGTVPGSEKPTGPEGSTEAESVDVTEQDDSYNSLLSAPPSHLTWLESRREAVLKEESEQYSEARKNMRKTLKELRDTIQEMMRENETLPEIERLELNEFNLDVEEQRRLDAMVEQEVIRVRNEIEWEMLAKSYLRDVLKKECWDSMKVKGKAIEAFHSEHEVKNYPLRERTEKELEDLRRVQDMRKFEKAACISSPQKSSNTTGAKEKEQGEDSNGAESTAVTGSFSAQLGYSNPYIYDQFSLQTTEQRINQMILLQDVIYRIKTGFNANFEAMHKQKVQELSRVRDRNQHIKEIMLELDMNETLWEPSLTVSEWPERLLTVDDSEIKAEKYLTPEQKVEEERKKLEEQRRLAAKGDNFRERALDNMMDGALEVKKENILKMEIPPPEFVLTKPVIHWTEEEKKIHKEYEKKDKDLNEEKEKYKKALENEIKKLQAATKDVTERFDETLKQLFEKKLNCEMTIYQEELKMTYLAYSVLVEVEMTNRELELKRKLEKTVTYKDEIGEQLKTHEEEVELFHENYNTTVAEDKGLDKEFRKEFFNVPGLMVDHLYKLFKRRPRVQKMRTQTDNNSNPFKEQHLCGSLAPDALGKMLKAMEDLDAPENMPKGLNRSIWDKFCLVRRAKVESEQKVKLNALTLAEMQAFQQKRRDDDTAVQQEIKNLSDELERLHKERNRFLMDIMVQVLLKPDQVEVSLTDMIADFTDSVLYPRSVVEDLNTTVRSLGGQKIASMVGCKDFRKGIIQLQWEHKKMAMQIEDLNNKKRDIQKLQLSKEQQDYLDSKDQDSRMSKQVSILEKTIAFQKKTHQQSVQHRRKKIEQLSKQAAIKAKKTKVVEQQLPNMQVAVAERRHIYEQMDSEEHQAAGTEERYQEIVQRSKLKDLAQAQAEDLAILRAEVVRLRMKNFPSLDQLKHV